MKGVEKMMENEVARTGAGRQDGDGWKVGNAAKIREALLAAGRAAREIQNVTEEADTADVAMSIAEICERALLFPLRNCDRPECCDLDKAVEEFRKLPLADVGVPDVFQKHRIFRGKIVSFPVWLYEHAAQEEGDHADA